MVERIAAQWESWELEDGARRSGKVANSLIFSMPPGTDPKIVMAAVRATATTHFWEHRYILAQHRDTDHPHVHLVYALRDIHGDRTFLSHDDKQLLRESFAENLRTLGVDANATLRKARGLDDRQRPRGAEHRAREGREPSPVRASDGPVAADRRERRTTRLRDFVRDVFDRAITELRQRSDPEGAVIAASLERFTCSMPQPQPAGQGRTTIVELGGERIDVSALDPASRKEVLAMAAQAAARGERDLARRAGVPVGADGRRTVELGGERIELDRLEPSVRRELLEIAARARERDGPPSRPGSGLSHDATLSGTPPRRENRAEALQQSADRVKDATKAIEQQLRNRSRDKGGPSR